MTSRGRRRGRGSPFSTFSIIYTDIPDIPDHYGHSAWRSRVSRKPTAVEAEMERKYRRALSFREWGGRLAPRDPQATVKTMHELDQCAEYISLPYVLKFAQDYLHDGEQKKKIIVYCLTMTADNKLKIPFCMNCRLYVKQVVRDLEGLRIVDFASSWNRAPEGQFIYQSDATVSLNQLISVP